MTTSHADRRLPLPPFGQDIDPKDDLVMVYCGRRAWKLAEPSNERVASLAFPRGRDPAQYRWPVHSKQVLVHACGEKQGPVDLLIVELLRAGARIVYAKYTDESDLVIYDPANRRRQAVA